jgi:hypothetical protein
MNSNLALHTQTHAGPTGTTHFDRFRTKATGKANNSTPHSSPEAARLKCLRHSILVHGKKQDSLFLHGPYSPTWKDILQTIQETGKRERKREGGREDEQTSVVNKLPRQKNKT